MTKGFLIAICIIIAIALILFPLIISYKDQKEDTYFFLDKYGNPYDEISYDSDGNIAINWGVYGVPETFIINKNGIIILRHPGPITTNVLKNEIIPILDEINL